MQARFLPWRDRSGRLSALKLCTFVVLFGPGLWVALGWKLGWLAPKPVTEAIHETGLWAFRILIASLTVSPLRRIAQWPKLIAVRRMLGVAVLAYAAVHFTLYVVDQKFDLVHVASEIVLRFYLTIGFIALLGFAALGATSTDAMIKRLGGLKWNRLHALVYPIAVLALLHFMIQSKLDVSQPVIMTGLFAILMGQRLLQRFDLGDSIAGLAGLAVAAPILTALFEAAWYHVRNGIDVADVLGADLAFDDALRPAWFVLAAGVVVVVLRVTRHFWARRPRPVARLRAAE
jgi:sulfoxide reductase heme-binding subunit YedZ